MAGMLKILASTTLTVLVLTVCGFGQVDPSGRWSATLKRGDAIGEAVMTLKVAGNQVTGTLSDPSGQILQSKMEQSKTVRSPSMPSPKSTAATREFIFLGR